jgi:hypothetical protein
VYRLLEQLSRRRFPGLDGNTRIGDALGCAEDVSVSALGVPEVSELLAAIEKKLAAEEEMIEMTAAEEPPEPSVERVVGRALLGRAGNRSTWDPLTVWSRSVRAVVNERVKWRGDCSCWSTKDVQE